MPHTASSAATVDDPSSYYAELGDFGLKPLWSVLRQTLTPQPVRREVPYLWRWHDVRPRLLRAGELISAEEAERRVLMFINPGNAQAIASTATLYAAMQLILPGEVAPAHRHSPCALRFAVEGKGAYTCVEGSRIDMLPGDLILTPSGVWHDHGNDGNEPVMWMDGLDIPMLLAFNCMFFEHRDGRQPQTERVQLQQGTFGRGLFPMPERTGSVAPRSHRHSPVWAYPWEDVRQALQLRRDSSDADPHFGHCLRYVNPATGGEVMPSIGCRAQLLTAGQRTHAFRSTVSAVYHVVEGSGESVIDGVRMRWSRGDTFAVPIWSWCEHEAEGADATLFSFHDGPVIEALGLVREEAFLDGGRQQIRSTFGERASG